ncbi:leukocyte surface antigen CD53-like [Chanos chanos]|uniref:Tetraspanin n=1 Tax=Chanos chanos TaxID=29144 RepID=A0A6J2WTB9_CHACN|nr:leukocyte surface antigen CD53-like [Chanos chanos]
MSCLKILKYTMCVVNFICFICGVAVFGLGIYMMINFKFASLIPTLRDLNIANTLFIIGIIITCVSFLGFMGSLKENRCLLISFFSLLFLLMLAEFTMACTLLVYEDKVNEFLLTDLQKSLNTSKSMGGRNRTKHDWDILQDKLNCCGIQNVTDWKLNIPDSCCIRNDCSGSPQYKTEGCYTKAQKFLEDNLLSIGVGVIVICSIEVLGMCFAMTLFCHISRTGLGYK